jgi:hypothetical protein
VALKMVKDHLVFILLAGTSFKVITYDLFGTASLYKTQLSFINFIMKRLMLRVGRIIVLFG